MNEKLEGVGSPRVAALCPTTAGSRRTGRSRLGSVPGAPDEDSRIVINTRQCFRHLTSAPLPSSLAAIASLLVAPNPGKVAGDVRHFDPRAVVLLLGVAPSFSYPRGGAALLSRAALGVPESVGANMPSVVWVVAPLAVDPVHTAAALFQPLWSIGLATERGSAGRQVAEAPAAVDRTAGRQKAKPADDARDSRCLRRQGQARVAAAARASELACWVRSRMTARKRLLHRLLSHRPRRQLCPP